MKSSGHWCPLTEGVPGLIRDSRFSSRLAGQFGGLVQRGLTKPLLGHQR